MRPGVGFLEINTVEQNTIEELKMDVVVEEAKFSPTKSQSILEQLNIAMQSNPLLGASFPPDKMVDLLPLPYSTKQEMKEGIKKNQEFNQQLEIAKAIKPPSVTASLSDIEMLDPSERAQMLEKYFKIQPSSDHVPAEQGKIQNDMMMAQQKHQQELAQSQDKHNAELSMKQQQSEHGMGIKEAETIHNLQLKSLENKSKE